MITCLIMISDPGSGAIKFASIKDVLEVNSYKSWQHNQYYYKFHITGHVYWNREISESVQSMIQAAMKWAPRYRSGIIYTSVSIKAYRYFP